MYTGDGKGGAGLELQRELTHHRIEPIQRNDLGAMMLWEKNARN